MSGDSERLLEAALKLSSAERAELAAILADSIGDGTPDAEIESAWIAEAKRRLQDVRSGKSTPLPWDQVDRKLTAMLDATRNGRTSTG